MLTPSPGADGASLNLPGALNATVGSRFCRFRSEAAQSRWEARRSIPVLRNTNGRIAGLSPTSIPEHRNSGTQSNGMFLTRLPEFRCSGPLTPHLKEALASLSPPEFRSSGAPEPETARVERLCNWWSRTSAPEYRTSGALARFFP